MRDRGKTPNRKIQLHHRDLCKVFLKKLASSPEERKDLGYWFLAKRKRRERGNLGRMFVLG